MISVSNVTMRYGSKLLFEDVSVTGKLVSIRGKTLISAGQRKSNSDGFLRVRGFKNIHRSNVSAFGIYDVAACDRLVAGRLTLAKNGKAEDPQNK